MSVPDPAHRDDHDSAGRSGSTTPGRVGGVGASPRVTLLSKPGCHLCDVARSVIDQVAADLDVDWGERDIRDSPADMERYWDKIPVTLVDNAEHAYWRVSEDGLRAALTR